MLSEADTIRSLLNRLRKHQATFYGHVMRREKKHLVRTGMVEGKCSKGKQHEKMLDGLMKRLRVGRVTKATRDRDAWKVKIAFA